MLLLKVLFCACAVSASTVSFETLAGSAQNLPFLTPHDFDNNLLNLTEHGHGQLSERSVLANLCSPTEWETLRTAWGQAAQMINVATAAMNTIVTILTEPTQAYNLGRDATAQIQWNTFCAIFGGLEVKKFPLTKEQTASMLSYAKYVRDVFQSMKDKMAVPANLDIELMCSDTWLAPTDPKGKPHPQPGYFWDSRTNPASRPNAAVNGWIYTGVDGKCTPGDAGFTITQMWETSWDVITFCQSQFRNWIEQHQNRDTLQHVCAAPAPQGMRIDVLMDDKLARTVVHELSHSVNAVGQGFHNEDGAYVSPIDDQPEGYGFFNVIKLADKPELAVKNADSYSYFAAAVYCSRNNWSDGWAKPNDSPLRNRP